MYWLQILIMGFRKSKDKWDFDDLLFPFPLNLKNHVFNSDINEMTEGECTA